MDFKNRIKGSITQTLVKALLQDAGYHIISLGVEEVIREVAALPLSEYKQLELPHVLRKMPDFFVSDQYVERAWLVEVKYRKEWNDRTRTKLGKDIYEQVKSWSPLFLIIFLGTSTKPNNENPANSIGVIKLEYDNGKIVHKWEKRKPLTKNEVPEIVTTDWDDISWGNFSRFQDIFLDVSTRWESQTILQAFNILKSLKAIDFFE